jgi:ABC-type multidrug transport system ATPase subunit
MASAISLREITKIFGRFAALRGISLELAAGKLYVLVGDNGAGKSTLLRIITGLAKPTTGTVQVHGSVGYMAHASMLYDELRGIENLRYFAALYGLPEKVCAQAMQTVGLDPALERRARDYSQGMRQRLSLGRAILNDPAVLLLDEPFANVDATSTAQMAELLRCWRDSGKAVVVVTHQPAALEGIADEFIRMDAGRIVSRESSFREVMA